MRIAGRFARRVKAWGAANGVPVIFCTAGERKHRITEAYLAEHEVGVGVFLVLVAKAPAPVWKVARSSKTGAIVNIERRREYVNHYSFQCAMRHSVVSPTQLLYPQRSWEELKGGSWV